MEKNIKHYLLLSFISLLIFSCDGGCNQGNSSVEPISVALGESLGENLDIAALVQRRGKVLVPACLIIPISKISEILNLPIGDIEIRDSSPQDANPSHSSCFFKWEDPAVLSAGILLQLMKNPMGDEYPDYIQRFIDSKRLTGEQTIEGDKELFQTFEGFGDDGAYSYEAGKYYWQMDNTVLMGIAFNTSHNEQQQYQIATEIATEMIQNYASGL